MKTTAITTTSNRLYDSVLEEIIDKGHIALKELAQRNAKQSAKENMPAPKGDSLEHRIGVIKTGYEKLSSDSDHYLQVESHISDAKIEADHFKVKDKTLENEIIKKENKNKNDEHELGNFKENNIFKRLLLVVLFSFFIHLGETVFNVQSFQIMGDNMLYALIISIGVSVTAFVFSHGTPLLYKWVSTPFKKRLVLLISFVIITTVFYACSLLRADYLAEHGKHINPLIFITFNLFFFLTSAMLSFFILPSYNEIRENMIQQRILNRIKKRKQEIKLLELEREEIQFTVSERTKKRLAIINYANSSNERICKMYFESIETYKSTNINYRNDKMIPECFSEHIPALDIKIIILH